MPWIRFLAAACLLAATGYAVQRFAPGTVVDRIAFETLCRAGYNPPFLVGGEGSLRRPWSLRVLLQRPPAAHEHAPVVVAIDDDPHGTFQSSPPSALDLAVILRNLERLGAERLGLATLMAWERADAFSLTGLERSLTRFPALTTSAPLSRGAADEPMPPAFRNASVAASSVRGDVLALPAVNRLPIPGTVLGGEDGLAGFSHLESEPASDSPHLLALWDDRVVLAFPLVAIATARGIAPEDLEIRLGHHIRLGAEGAVVPIDHHGRLKMRVPAVGPRLRLSAADLVLADDDLLAGHQGALLLLTEETSASDPARRALSRELPRLVAAMASDSALTPPQVFRRLPESVEWGLLGGWALLLTALTRLGGLSRQCVSAALAALLAGSLAIATNAAALWLPGLAALAMLLLAWLWPEPKPRPAPAPSPTPVS